MTSSWSHLLVRPLVRPLLRLRVRPNHVTAVHLVFGLLVLGAIAFGDEGARFAAGFGWLLACLLDRLDGELARIGNMKSEWGHRFDYLTDMWLSALFFLALGLSVRGPAFPLAAGMGAVATLCQLANCVVAERHDRLAGGETKVLASKWGFDADDALYILGPLAWLPAGGRLIVVLLAGVGTATFLAIFVHRFRRLRAARA